MSIGALGKQEFSAEQAAKAAANVPKEPVGLPDINVSSPVSSSRCSPDDDVLVARTFRGGRAQEPEDASPGKGVGLWQDIYGPYAHGRVVEGDGMGGAVDQGV